MRSDDDPGGNPGNGKGTMGARDDGHGGCIEELGRQIGELEERLEAAREELREKESRLRDSERRFRITFAGITHPDDLRAVEIGLLPPLQTAEGIAIHKRRQQRPINIGHFHRAPDFRSESKRIATNNSERGADDPRKREIGEST